MLTTTNTFEIEPQFLKLISAIVYQSDLNKIVQEKSPLLIEALIANLKTVNMNQSINEHTDTENIENISLNTSKSNKRMTHSFFEPKTKPIVKSKNLSENFILISDILLALTGIKYERNVKKREENIELILELTSQPEPAKLETVEELEMYYAKLTDIRVVEKKTSQYQLTGLINLKAYKSIVDKLKERTKKVCQSVEFSFQSEINDSEMNKILLDEFFLQLDYCSALVTYAAKSQTSLDLNILIKQIKSVSGLISMNCKKLLISIIQHETPTNEKRNVISQLEFILVEILFNYSIHIYCNETHLHLFLYSLDSKLLELLLQFMSSSNDADLATEQRNEFNETSGDASRTNECLKKIFHNATLSLTELERSISELEQVKLIALAFLSSVTVEYIYLNERAKKVPLNTKELNAIGKSLKKHLLSICGNYFEKFNSQKSKTELLVFKENTLACKSMNKLFSLIFILNSFKHRNSSGIDWIEFKLILDILKSLVANNYLNCCTDPVLSKLVLKLMSAYASKLLMVNSFLSWFEANLNHLVPNLNTQHLNTLKSAYISVEAIQDDYIEIVNCIQLLFLFFLNFYKVDLFFKIVDTIVNFKRFRMVLLTLIFCKYC